MSELETLLKLARQTVLQKAEQVVKRAKEIVDTHSRIEFIEHNAKDCSEDCLCKKLDPDAA